MDYSKVKFVTPSVDGEDLTKGKVYAVSGKSPHGLPVIIDDEGEVVIIRIDMCAHLNGAHWIPCLEDGTPLTKEFTALEAEMLAMLEDIHSELINHTYKIEELIKKAKQ